MKCPKCNTSIPNNCKFCPECGADIRFAFGLTKSSSPLTSRISKPVENRKAAAGSEFRAQNRELAKKKNRLGATTEFSLSGLADNSKTEGKVRESERKEKRVQLWSEGPYWAMANIGAEDPWDCGYYFWWGDTVGYRHEKNKWVASNGAASNFSFINENTTTCKKSIKTLQCEGWVTPDHTLTLEHDAAHVHWGGAWRMPTDKELSDLCYKCDWTWMMMNGVHGCIVRGRGDFSSDSIFLPSGGRVDGTSLGLAGSGAIYWSSVPRGVVFHYNSADSDCDNDCACYLLNTSSGFPNALSYCRRKYGLLIRPVQGFTE